ncbi:glycosyltransferase family 4 protein [Levilinea saccharolytica]|uniref:glycosyltransferase family 4 protein n=1 Tax=Levilinea saccharolytica TaxID=229921 RepID=UPI0009E5F38E|nr:glycosyltransferase family 4 protein [Levilinea saccharolytica]GAP18821.1 glycosyltransferase [Levilinea saccharolytica]
MVKKMSLREKGVAFFPNVEKLSGNPYWPMLARELEKTGVIFCSHTPDSFNLKWLIDNRHNVKILNLHFVQQFYKSSTNIKKLIKLFLFAWYMIAARVLGYRTVFTLHNLEGTYVVQPAWMDYLGHWIAANLSDRVIVYCNEARKLLAQRYGRRKGIYYVDHPNLINHYPNRISKEAARKRLHLPDTSLTFAFFGGVRPNKGVDILIQAFLKLKNDNYRLVIAGDIFPPEAYAQSLQDMAAGDERIKLYLKPIPDDEIQVYINASDIIVLPFAKILTSGTANLAMSFARPVIVPRMGCLPELVTPDFGWLFQPDNPDCLAEVMEKAASQDVEGVGQQAFNKLSQFTPERFAQQTLIAYFENSNCLKQEN